MMQPVNLLSGNIPDEPYFIILLCLMPEDLKNSVLSAATQWADRLDLVILGSKIAVP
jgi:hypothetical protein